jgi:hypothetical protein
MRFSHWFVFDEISGNGGIADEVDRGYPVGYALRGTVAPRFGDSAIRVRPGATPCGMSKKRAVGFNVPVVIWF